MNYLLWLLIGYIAGSCPTGYFLVKLIKGQDIRSFGSGNIGATNVGRLMGRKFAVFVAVFDMLKGGLVVLVATFFVKNETLLALIGTASVLGHNYPVWLKFKGGKGVATTFGVIAFYNLFNPIPALIGGISWFIIMKTTRYVSIASMLGLMIAAFSMLIFRFPLSYFYAGIFLSILAIYRHKTNIKKIHLGTEIKVQ